MQRVKCFHLKLYIFTILDKWLMSKAVFLLIQKYKCDLSLSASDNFQMILKVVDHINSAPKGSRPTVLVSATAVGYYGLFPTQIFASFS